MTEPLQTVSPDQLGERATPSDDLFAVVFAPSGPLQKLAFSKLLSKLISTQLVKTTKALLDADLAHAADEVALVFNDPTATLNGWYRKTGASGAGAWDQFEVLTKAALDAVSAALLRTANSVPFATYAGLAATTGMVAGDRTRVRSTDTGTHASLTGDYGASGGNTPNAGEYLYTTGVGWVRTADLDSQLAKGYADSLNARLNFFSVAGGEYAATFGKPFGPILLSFVDATGHADFSGVRTLPIAARDGTIVANIAGSTKRDGFLFYAYDTISRALLFGLQNDGTFVANFNVPEVTTARGTAADLNTRLSRGLTAAGSPKTGTQNVGRLAALRSALTYLKNGGSALVHIMLDGDSWWDAKTYGSTDAITRFFADSGLTNAGPGWIGLASGLAAGTAIHGAAQNNITVTRSGTWNDLFHSTDIPAGTPQNFPGYDAVQSGADGSIYTLVGSAINNCTSLTLFCGKGGTVEQSWDGGTTWTSVTVAAGSGSTTATISMTGKTNTLKLRCTSGTVIAGLFGLSAASGVVFSNFSSSGSTAAQHASVQSNADYKAMMAALPGDALVALIQLGLNDTKAGTANATIVTNVAAVAAGYKAVFTGLPPCDIVLLCQPNTPLSVQDTLAPLLRSCAEDIGAAFVDWQLYFGMPAYSGDYSSYGRDYTSGAVSTALPLLEVESGYRHPSPISRLTAAGKSAAVTGSGVVASTLSNLLLSPTRSN